MNKPQDSDIFGTKNTHYAPRIINNSRIDPNAQFQAKMDAQYDQYAKKVHSNNRQITRKPYDYSCVNQQANFNENYHHSRKQADMRSSIFGSSQYSLQSSRISNNSRLVQRVIPKHASLDQIQGNFGRRQVLKRQVDKLPQNNSQIKGNGSTLFGYNEKEQQKNNTKLTRLIPHQMNWDEHDSVKYREIDINNIQDKPLLIPDCPQELSQSKSVVFIADQESHKQNNLEASNLPILKKQQQKKDGFKKKQSTKYPSDAIKKTIVSGSIKQNKIEIKILKGWSPSILQDLSKYCRINNTKILGVDFEQGKGNLTLQKSKRWQVITDWLRRDAKLKIRVNN